MKRRDFLIAGTAALALSGAVRAQKKTPVIGLLWIDSVKPSPYVAPLLDGLHQRGWVAGRDLRIEDRVSLEGYAGYESSVADLVRAKVDVIVAYGTTAATAAAKATKDIPIVMLVGVDPVAAGLVPSLSRPGGNLTGVATMATALNAKRVQLLRELNPGVSSIGVVLAPNVGNPINRRESEDAARAREPGADRLGEKRNRRRRHYADYGASTVEQFRSGAVYVDKILRGAKPADLPVQQASKFELVINMKTAKAIGVAVPSALLVRADRVIE